MGQTYQSGRHLEYGTECAHQLTVFVCHSAVMTIAGVLKYACVATVVGEND
jgi:hypothetical protein